MLASTIVCRLAGILLTAKVAVYAEQKEIGLQKARCVDDTTTVFTIDYAPNGKVKLVLPVLDEKFSTKTRQLCTWELKTQKAPKYFVILSNGDANDEFPFRYYVQNKENDFSERKYIIPRKFQSPLTIVPICTSTMYLRIAAKITNNLAVQREPQVISVSPGHGSGYLHCGSTHCYIAAIRYNSLNDTASGDRRDVRLASFTNLQEFDQFENELNKTKTFQALFKTTPFKLDAFYSTRDGNIYNENKVESPGLETKLRDPEQMKRSCSSTCQLSLSWDTADNRLVLVPTPTRWSLRALQQFPLVPDKACCQPEVENITSRVGTGNTSEKTQELNASNNSIHQKYNSSTKLVKERSLVQALTIVLFTWLLAALFILATIFVVLKCHY